MTDQPDDIRPDGGPGLTERDGEHPEGNEGPSFDPDLPEDSLFTEGDYYGMYKVAAHPLRHTILRELRDRDRLSASEISEIVERRANDLHYHLRKLKRAALIRNHRGPRSGTDEAYSFYTLTPLGGIVLDEGIETGVQRLATQEHEIQEIYSE